MEIQLLGPVTALAGGKRVEIDRPAHQLFLAVLASAGGRHTPAETLIDAIWPLDDPDERKTNDPASRLYEIASDVRAALNRAGCDARAILSRGNHGYRLSLERDKVDLLRFHDVRHRADAAVAESVDDRAVELYRDALRLWGGDGGFQHRAEPFAGLTGPWVRHQRVQLDEAYRATRVHCAEAELRLGRHRQLLPELIDLTVADPFDEHIANLVMRAFYGVGQSNKASEFYTDFRKRLVAELGNEPSASLQALHQRVLNRDPDLSLAESPVDIGRTDPSRGPSGKEQAVAEEQFFITARDNAKVGTQVGKLVGDYHADARSSGSDLGRGLRRLGRELRAAYRGGRVSGETMTAATAELNRASAQLDDAEALDIEAFATTLEDFQRLVDGADELVDLADELIDAARKGER